MTDTRLLARQLWRDEGEVRENGRHVVYKDHLGNDTVGCGRLVSRGFSQDEVDLMLQNDIRDSMKDLDRNIPWWRSLPEPKMRALTNMVHNLGINRFLGFKRMLAAMEAGDFNEAASQALDSKWSNQVGERAKRIAALIRGGEV